LAVVFTVFVANLARPAAEEADVLASALGMTPYAARLALAAGTPAVLLRTADRNRAADVAGMLRSRGHGAHVFDDENFVPSEAMTKVDNFQLDVEGMRRTSNGDLLPYGDVFAILRSVHDTSETIERPGRATSDQDLVLGNRVVSKNADREQVIYFFRRSGEKPWLLRERHASYVGLGAERTPIAFANFTRTLTRMREASPMAVYDDRLVRRRVSERAAAGGERSTRQGMDLLAHLLAMTIASQGGSPYR
jgi:hypothetical protein